MINFTGNRILNIGVANEASICWAIAEKLYWLGAEQAFMCHPSMIPRVEKLVAHYRSGSMLGIMACDFSDPASVDEAFESLLPQAPFQGVLHGIAWADRNELRGAFTGTSRENFLKCMEVSVYSLIEVGKWARRLMPVNGSVVTLTYDASRATLPHYNVMGIAKGALETTTRYLATELGEYGIRVNAISASPENTLSARGIRHFRFIGDHDAGMSPMGRRAGVAEIASHAAYLLSDQSTGVSGQVQFVDCGTSIVRMAPARSAGKMGATYMAIDETMKKESAVTEE